MWAGTKQFPKLQNRLIAIPAIDSALMLEIANLISDEDYQASFLEEVASHYLTNSHLSQADLLISHIKGLERPRILSKLAQTALRIGKMEYAETLFSQTLDAGEANRFAIEKSLAKRFKSATLGSGASLRSRGRQRQPCLLTQAAERLGRRQAV